MKPIQNFKSHLGITLIELMVVVAIVGILAAVGYPNYQDYVRRSKRADAQAIMTEDAQFLERYFTTNGTYAGAVLPKTQSPANGTATPDYQIAPALTPTTYLITATPTAPFSDPSCGNLTIDQTGNRGASAGSVADCWKN